MIWTITRSAGCFALWVPIFARVILPHLDEIALAVPDLVVVAHHIGDPWTDMSVRLAARHPNLYICTSAWSPERYPAALTEFLTGRWHGTSGAEKVLFASDFPLLDIERATRDARALELDEAAPRAVLHDNARRLFWPEDLAA